jgi:ubiquitin-conjugating enzyme E2 variant
VLGSDVVRTDTRIVSQAHPALPVHYELTRGQIVFSSCAIAAAGGLLGLLGWRIATRVDVWQWWVPLALTAGFTAADFGSGLIHWAADTWGRDDCPIIGPRLLVPFRVHHVNPDDFLRRRFVDTNGEVAAIAVPVLVLLNAVPFDTGWGAAAAVFGFAFCALGSLTNQIHQWSHMPSPPACIRELQAWGVLLGRTEHAAHHSRPYDRHYCITTGWCNRPLDAIAFFRRMERAITAVTGVSPRHDDHRYEIRYAMLATPPEPHRG